MEYAIKHKTLYEILFRYRNLFTDVFMLLLSVVVMATLANIRIPLWPVPITMQTFGVFLVAFFFGSRKGLVAMLLYLLTGLLGFGVFAGYKSGYAAFIGPTGGYLIGFLAAVVVVGHMIQKGYCRTKKSVLVAMIVGNLVIYVVGLFGLHFYLGNSSLWQVLKFGLFPFMIGDALKMGIALPLFPYLFSSKKI